ncbi:hypothetical protein C1702_05230 [Caldimonas thermodepolymerans]|uniref:Uncharacterized protein n=1 Tax=Caldimonas thermodepolymerans TaxID=215580 RepID=A0A2S5T7F6_9BURK|nr:hypothetical protein C1702_05230 [Caldimonas thermodepolymerans]
MVTTMPDAQGVETVLLGKATYDDEADLLTVSTLATPKRLHQTTQGGHGDLQALAKHLLRSLIRDASARS